MDMDDFEDTGHAFIVGTPLLEVFSVTVSKQSGGDRRTEMYGTIHVTDGRGIEAVLYNRDLQNSESINANETVTLTGTPRCISAMTGFTIHLNLKDVDGDLDIKDGKISWDLYDALYYDKRLSIYVLGAKGFATVNCAVFSVAVEAEVEIVFGKKDQADINSEIPPDVEIYGTIIGSYGNLFESSKIDQSRDFEITLFRQPAPRCLKVKLGEAIPLLKSFVAVPAWSSLVIEANLFLSDTREPILRGTTPELLPRLHYKSEIVGGSMAAQVNVTWGSSLLEGDFK